MMCSGVSAWGPHASQATQDFKINHSALAGLSLDKRWAFTLYRLEASSIPVARMDVNIVPVRLASGSTEAQFWPPPAARRTGRAKRARQDTSVLHHGGVVAFPLVASEPSALAGGDAAETQACDALGCDVEATDDEMDDTFCDDLMEGLDNLLVELEEMEAQADMRAAQPAAEGMPAAAQQPPRQAEDASGLAAPVGADAAASDAPPPPPPRAEPSGGHRAARSGAQGGAKGSRDLMVQAYGGTIVHYNTTAEFVATCPNPGHGRCVLSRKSWNPEPGAIQKAGGRPLGFLVAWLACAAETATKEEHWSFRMLPLMSQAVRVASRLHLQSEVEGGREMAAFERPLADDEPEEPETLHGYI